ncbi:MAG: hypothetical protein ACE5HE_15215 [Phycisphaerae bacterium]
MVAVALSLAVLNGAGMVCGPRTPPRPTEVTDAEIALLIRNLSDPDYEKRTMATRRLLMAGMCAEGPLREAARGDDVEVRLRAEHILATLGRLWFAGAEVSLSFTRSAIAWGDPVDLQLTVRNRSDYPTPIPFRFPPEEPHDAASDAAQVGMMLDIADFVVVRDDRGHVVHLRVDDITASPEVSQVVHDRLATPPSSILPAGEQLTITVRDFNRGWARYPLLDGGTYTVQLVYEPTWEDEVLASQHAGRVASEPATLQVTRAAPDEVARDGTTASITLQSDGVALVAKLTNRSDQPMVVNKNFGGGAPFAVALWVYTAGESVHHVPVSPKASPGLSDFDEGLLVNVEPGGCIELARTDLRTLLEKLASDGAGLDGEHWAIHFSYESAFGRQWQRRHARGLLNDGSAPAVLRHPASRRTLCVRNTSNSLKAPKPR